MLLAAAVTGEAKDLPRQPRDNTNPVTYHRDSTQRLIRSEEITGIEGVHTEVTGECPASACRIWSLCFSKCELTGTLSASGVSRPPIHTFPDSDILDSFPLGHSSRASINCASDPRVIHDARANYRCTSQTSTSGFFYFLARRRHTSITWTFPTTGDEFGRETTPSSYPGRVRPPHPCRHQLPLHHISSP